MAVPFLALPRLAWSFGRGLALSVLALGLLQPRTFVWCQAETGHAALEALESGCCAGPGLGVRCFPGANEAETSRRGDGEAVESEACRDVLVEAPARLPHDERLSAGPLADLAPSPRIAVPPEPGRAPKGREVVARATAHDLILTTVLRN